MDLKPQNLLLSARENPVLKLAGMNFNTDQPFSIKAYAFLGVRFVICPLYNTYQSNFILCPSLSAVALSQINLLRLSK